MVTPFSLLNANGFKQYILIVCALIVHDEFKHLIENSPLFPCPASCLLQ